MTWQKKRPAGTLKAAQAALIAAAGGVKAATRIGKTLLQQCSDADKPERHLPVDVVAELEARAGVPLVTADLALAAGHLLIPLPRADALPYPLALAEITSAEGELLARGAQALRDGHLSPVQAGLLSEQAMKIASSCAALIADCRAVMERGA